MIAATLLLSALCYLGVYYWAARRASSRFSWLRRPQLVAWLLAVIASIVVLGATAASPFWSRSTEIAWTGLESETPSTDLRVGGGDQAVVGWPNGAFSPVIRFSGSRPGHIEIAGGAGFVKHPNGAFLNGLELPLGRPVRVRDFVIEVRRRWLFWRQVSVRRASDNEELSRFDTNAPRRDRVVDIDLAVNSDVIQLRANKSGAKAAELERWANGLRLLIPRDGSYRILDPEAPEVSAEVPLDGELVVEWLVGHCL